jgi:hypothetical protein
VWHQKLFFFLAQKKKKKAKKKKMKKEAACGFSKRKNSLALHFLATALSFQREYA